MRPIYTVMAGRYLTTGQKKILIALWSNLYAQIYTCSGCKTKLKSPGLVSLAFALEYSLTVALIIALMKSPWFRYLIFGGLNKF